METLLKASFASYLSANFPKTLALSNGLNRNYRSSCLAFPYRYGQSVVVCAKKNKEDTHSFVPKPDEATGIFPEAVLLKEKKIQKDGTLLPEFADEEEEKLYEYLNLELESSLNVAEMRHYEVVYLIHEKHVEEVGTVNEKIQDFIKEKKGKIWRFSDWGLRRLAYKIKKATHAHYILMNFEIGAKWINDFKSMLDKDERVIRHLVMKKDEAETEDCPPPLEFHTLRADMDDYEEDDDIDYYDEGDSEDWEEEGEVEEGHEDDLVPVGSNYDDADDEKYKDNISTSAMNASRKNARSEKAVR